MTTTGLAHPAVDAALATAATLLGMDVVFVGSMSEESFRFERLHGDWPGLHEGLESDRTDSFCHRMLAGAPCSTSNAAIDSFYSDAPIRTRLSISSYVGVPIRDADGAVIGTLCGLDRGSVSVDEATIDVLRDLARVVAAHMTPALQTAVIRRTPEGWRVGEETTDDLVSAIVLSDLIAGELPRQSRPPRAEQDADELTRLRLTVEQLEHALAARVTIEQAIGVISERRQVPPREAFETLRSVARVRGARIQQLACDVVASTTSATELPAELA
jgi:hypothetical protein